MSATNPTADRSSFFSTFLSGLRPGPGVVARWLSPTAIAWSLPWLILGFYAANHYWVCDDAHISFRYAHNLLNGHGLVFNVGERVEGYTNFLWLIEVAALSVVGIPMPIGASVLSVLATIGTVWLTIQAARKSAFPAFAGLAGWTALLFVATNRNIAIFTTSGLETRQFTFLLLLALGLVQRGFRRPKLWIVASFVLGALELTRPEGALVAGCVNAWALLQLLRRGQPAFRRILCLALPFGVILVVHYLWRYSYYQEWLPNTYYAKAIRPWPDMGILYYGAAFLESGGYLTIPLAIVGGYLRWLRRRDPGLSLAAFVLIPHIVYLISVGGDHFEFRPLDFYWPLIAIGLADAMAGLAVGLRLLARQKRWWKPRLTARVPWGLSIGVLLVYTTILPLGQYVIEHPHRSDPDIEGHIPEALSEKTFPLAYAVPFLGPIADAYSNAMVQLIAHTIAVRWIEHYVFENKVQRLFGVYNRPDRARFPESGIMNFSWMGIGPYALPEVTIVDNFGLTDKVVARNRRPRNRDRSMAHDRRAPPGYMKSRGLNFRIQPGQKDCMAALKVAPYAVQLAEGLCAPFVSSDPQWVRSAFQDMDLFHFDWSRPSRSIAFGRAMVEAERLLSCEKKPVDWKLEGASCVKKPGRRQGKVTGQGGKFWLSTFDPRRGDRTTGRSLSPEFIPRQGDALLFKIAGGQGNKTRLALVDSDGKELAAFSGANLEVFEPVVHDLNPQVGQSLRVAVIDESDGFWGHLLVDSVILLRATKNEEQSAPSHPVAPAEP